MVFNLEEKRELFEKLKEIFPELKEIQFVKDITITLSFVEKFPVNINVNFMPK